MLIPLKFKAGINRETSRYSNDQGWWDCDKVRFRSGLPEKMGGWLMNLSTAFIGTCRALISWALLNGTQYLGLGTNVKYYVTQGGSYTDVTPIRRTANPLANNPFTSTNGSTTVTVTDVGHAATLGDYVTYSGASTFAGIPAAELNIEHIITSIVDVDHYTTSVVTAATSGASGGGAVVVAAYQLNVGLDTTIYGLGWGAGTWGHDTWGSDATSGVAISLRIWSHDTFGQDLVTNVRNGGCYYWDSTVPSNRMLALSALGGASDAPTIASQILCSAEARHVVALGVNQIGSAVQDKMFVRWSVSESAVNWTPAITNTAGGSRLSAGSYIIGGLKTRSEILIWTDTALYSMHYVGGDFEFGFTQMGTNISAIGPQTMISVNDIAFWMGAQQFYLYDGRIQPLPCPVKEYVFNRLNLLQLDKVFAFTNSNFNEVGWLYPSTTNECDSYVIFNYVENCWYYGALSRTAWLDRGPIYYPIATGSDLFLYNHEVGFDDGSTNPPSAIAAYIESSPLEQVEQGVNAGDRYIFVDKLIPDITFRNSTATAPSASMTVKMQDYPGAPYATAESTASSVVQASTAVIEQFTQLAYIRLRGRSLVFRCESSAAGVTWRMGTPRVSIRDDGRK